MLAEMSRDECSSILVPFLVDFGRIVDKFGRILKDFPHILDVIVVRFQTFILRVMLFENRQTANP